MATKKNELIDKQAIVRAIEITVLTASADDYIYRALFRWLARSFSRPLGIAKYDKLWA